MEPCGAPTVLSVISHHKLEDQMRLVKRGNDPKFEIWKATCYRCKSEFEATQAELTITDDQRDGRFGRANESCSVCGGRDVIFYPPAGGR